MKKKKKVKNKDQAKIGRRSWRSGEEKILGMLEFVVEGEVELFAVSKRSLFMPTTDELEENPDLLSQRIKLELRGETTSFNCGILVPNISSSQLSTTK